MLNYFALIMQKTIQSNLDAYYDQNGIIPEVSAQFPLTTMTSADFST